MIIHEDKKLFEQTIRAASEKLKIKEEFIEMDYWIALILLRLSSCKHMTDTVFKGGTSLSKAYNLINRFSTDIDIAVINRDQKSGNQIKSLLRKVEKDITVDLEEETVLELTSKGSRFRKSVFKYPNTELSRTGNQIIVEINSFANPFPYELKSINSFIHKFLLQVERTDIIDKYGFKTFEINVLKKEQTLIEKLVSLIRFSFSENPVESLEQKIRHFYDLYFLAKDKECKEFISTDSFKIKFYEIFEHDRQIFDTPVGWVNKTVAESVLVRNFDNTWSNLTKRYIQELTAYSYSETIPDSKDIAKEFKILISKIV